MRSDVSVLIAVSGLAMVAAGGVLLGIPPAGVMLALVMTVCTAAMVQGYYRRREQFFHDHRDPEVTVRRRHVHGQDTLSRGGWPWP